MRGDLSPSQCSPHLTPHMTHLTESNSNPTLHANSNCVAYASAIRLAISNKGDPARLGSREHRRIRSDIATTDFLPLAEPPSKSHVPPHAPAALHQLVHLHFRQRPTNAHLCSPLLPRRRNLSLSQRRTSGRGLSKSSTSLSDRFPKILTAKRIGAKDCSCSRTA